MLMMMDATILTLLGFAFIFCPGQIEEVFHFENVPPAMNFLIGLWGSVLLTLGTGYGVAAIDPRRHRLWVGTAVARGGLEAIFGLWCFCRGMVTWKQSGLGILLAAFMAIAYLVLYPRPTDEEGWKLRH
jgi:hypothetical protein